MFAGYVAVCETNVHPYLAASPAAWLQLAVKDLLQCAHVGVFCAVRRVTIVPVAVIPWEASQGATVVLSGARLPTTGRQSTARPTSVRENRNVTNGPGVVSEWAGAPTTSMSGTTPAVRSLVATRAR